MINWLPLSADEAEFLRLCEAHDLTYAYSDDYTYYEKGDRQYKRILALARKLDKDRVAAIWNSVVDEKIQSRWAQDFYWFPN